MKIISWNVNGLRSCIEKGFIEIVTKLNVDVICVQEIKTNKKSVELNIDGYQEYWNSSKRNGYSGVLVLSRLPVLTVREGFGNNKFDIEGRLLTIEFDDFYLLNVYIPMSKSRLSRNEYREEWDNEFFKYIKTLTKPIVICGDFNVAHKHIDVYPENTRNIKNPAGFIEFEKDNFTRLLNYGLVDIYRQKYPNTIKYTWWSNRLNKRRENKGWRLDYFLISHTLSSNVVDISILTHIMGSDHCPIQLNIKTKDTTLLAEEHKKLADKWDNINWKEFEDKLFKTQVELANATLYKKKSKMLEIKEKIINMYEAKALAVRHVSQSDTESGVDGIRLSTSTQKMLAVNNLDEKNFTPSPMKSIVIFDGKKERRINIPTFNDRAMSMLLKYALEPIEETQADRKSFGFRKGRSSFDACGYIELTMKKTPNLWVLKTDIKAFYENICHEWIFANMPCLKNSIQKLLRSGTTMNGELFPSDLGISLGLNLSPTIANMVLNGLQYYVQKKLYPNDYIEDFTYGDMIRYADDVLFFAKSEEQALEIKLIVEEFLTERGLKLSEEKTIIVEASDGFDFLGWNFKQINKIVKTTPSQNNIAMFEKNLEEKILLHNTSTESLIRKINKSIIGYANYHKHVDNTETFRHLDVVVNALLIKKVKKQHPKRVFNQLHKIYWYKNYNGEHIFTHPDKKHLQVTQFKDIPKVFHFTIKTNFNYFLDNEYYVELTKKRQEDKRVGDYSKMWKAQDGNCYFCGKPFLSDQFTKTIRLYQKNKNALIHSRCQYNMFQYIFNDQDVQALNIEEILEHPIADEVNTSYIGLREYFIKENRQVFTLTFLQIEEIIGEPLVDTEINFWYDNDFECIASCWLNNGYIIQKLVLDEKKIIFRKDNHTLASLKIPKSLTENKIPKSAQDELSAFMKYVVEKYGL